MFRILFLCLIFSVAKAQTGFLNSEYISYVFKSSNRSLIDWPFLSTEGWFDITRWKENKKDKESDPYWNLNYRISKLNEVVGRVISCIGTCRIYRGQGYSKGGYLSTVREGDEIETDALSYAWVFLMDGTLIRVSPMSSVTFTEINIAKSRIILFTRLNRGNIFYMNRNHSQYKESNLRETDPLFYPLRLLEANLLYYQIHTSKSLSEDKIIKRVLESDLSIKEHYKRLNLKILENNKWANRKKTLNVLVMPNATLVGHNICADLFYELGNKGYIRLRSQKDLVDEEYRPDLKLDLRGFKRNGFEKLETDKWYSISENGREYSEMSKLKAPFFGESLTKRIPSILLAREIMLARYSQDYFDRKITLEDLAKKHGYYLWGKTYQFNKSSRETDWILRTLFYIEYIRRIETGQLSAAFRVFAEKGETPLVASPTESRYFMKAWEAYTLNLSRSTQLSLKERKEIARVGIGVWLIKNARGR